MNKKADFGVLYGQKTTEDALLIYSSYEDSKVSPQTGDFIVLTPSNEDGTKYLARVEAEIYDEDPVFRSQDKTLVAVHYARIADRELSERDKQKIFSYTYKVRILGTFENNALGFTTAVRKLPTVSYHARHLNPNEVEKILNAENQNGIEIGHLCIGESFKYDNSIRFDIDKLRNRRTMVFAQSGFGKTNLVKVLLHKMISNTNYGKLIFDLNGEYFFNGPKTYGLGSINDTKIKDNLVLYTNKYKTNEEITKEGYAKSLCGKVSINMHEHLTVRDIIDFSTGFSEVMKSFLLYLDEEDVKDFVTNINSYVNNPQSLHIKYPDFWDQKKEASARNTIAAIRKRIAYLIDEDKGLHSASSNLVNNIREYLKQGKTVIVDLSLNDTSEASIISTILVRELFEYNKRYFSSNKPDELINAVIFVEEAQNVLSEELVKSNANPFVRLAKEGRKFGLGLVAITQRPSAISEEIRTQAENFFTFHMGNSDDIRALVKSNINYDGVISKFVQTETIKGNLYMVSSEQAFVLPVRVLEFEKLVEKSVSESLKIKNE